jgi:hypothetical protein
MFSISFPNQRKTLLETLIVSQFINTSVMEAKGSSQQPAACSVLNWNNPLHIIKLIL